MAVFLGNDVCRWLKRRDHIHDEVNEKLHNKGVYGSGIRRPWWVLGRYASKRITTVLAWVVSKASEIAEIPS